MTLVVGDHTGFTAVPVVRRIGLPPPIGILNSPGPFASLPSVTIHLASGDHAGVPLTVMVSARGTRSVPSADRRMRRGFPCRLAATATRSPAGEPAATPN